MKNIFVLVLLSLLFTNCGPKKDRKRKGPSSPKSATELVSGCYNVSKTPNNFLRIDVKTGDSLYLDPNPIVVVSEYKEVTITDKGYFLIDVVLNEKAKKKWAEATEKANDKKIGFIINNILVMAPTVRGKMDGGAFQITGDFTKEEIEGFYKQLDLEMYE